VFATNCEFQFPLLPDLRSKAVLNESNIRTATIFNLLICQWESSRQISATKMAADALMAKMIGISQASGESGFLSKYLRMHTHDVSAWRQDHPFDDGNIADERGNLAFMWIKAALMVAEVVAGFWTNSMALLAQHARIVRAAIEIHHCEETPA
jgi:hypothetical protein